MQWKCATGSNGLDRAAGHAGSAGNMVNANVKRSGRGNAKRLRRRAGGVRCFLASMLLSVVSVEARGDNTEPVDRFLDSLSADSSLPADATKLIRETWAGCEDCDPDEFLTQGLTLLSPTFRDALDAYDAGQFGRCAEICGELRADGNPFLAAHATAYEIKALVGQEKLLEAGARIEELYGSAAAVQRLSAYSYLAPEVSFLRGFCLLSDLRYEEAERALSTFVDEYPNASQRLMVAGQQMLAELRNRQAGRIGEVVDLMHYSGRRLTHGDTGEPVRERQQRILDILDRMIEDAQQQESSSSSSSSGGGGQQGSSGKNSPSTPMQDSMLPGGQPAEGPLQAGRKVNPGEAWGAMPPAERERILQALRDNFPSRYRQLVEQYYEELAKKP